MNIYIPSYNRATPTLAKTIRFFANLSDITRLKIMVRREQMEDYASLMLSIGKPHMCSALIPVAKPGVCAARNACVQHAIGSGMDRMLMADDDLGFSERCYNEEGQPRLRKTEDCDGVAYRLERLLDTYAHAAVSTRLGNVFEPAEAREVQRGIRCVAYRTDVLAATGLRFSIAGREGMNMTLSLFKLGYPNVVAYDYAQESCNRNVFDHEGQTEAEWTRTTAEALARNHPGIIAIMEKAYKKGSRTEVKVDWQRAIRKPYIYMD